MPEPGRRPRWGCAALLVILVSVIIFGWREYRRLLREDPQSIPWTELDLRDPVGRFTARKLAGLADDPGRCRALLKNAGSASRPSPAIRPSQAACGYTDGMRLEPEGRWRPAGLVTACPVAAALHLWEQDADRAAMRHLGQRVAAIDHFGSYSCRRIAGRSEADWSEHATADAIDVAGFRLSDGRRIGVLADWDGGGREAAFLRDVRDSACRLFATTLSPDYNEAHRDHLHLDMAARGASGFTMCR